MDVVDINAVKAYLFELQDKLCRELEAFETDVSFTEDKWTRDTGGEGQTRVLEHGKVLERAGVNFSHVYGEQLPASASAKRPELAGCAFQAMGVSLVVHPLNPYVPTTHCNVRFFIAKRDDQPPIWWFGGGFDLTPYYPFKEDCKHWHQMAYQACQPFGETVYPQFKTWCDEYFYLPHRKEHRGIGGLFFDDLNRWDFATCFAFIKSIGTHFSLAYLPILKRRKGLVYGQRQRDFQLYRRGRYVEFNLIYDRGTLFGLQSGGRTESILMSMPPEVQWRYGWVPEPGSKEETLYKTYLVPQTWIDTSE